MLSLAEIRNRWKTNRSRRKAVSRKRRALRRQARLEQRRNSLPFTYRMGTAIDTILEPFAPVWAAKRRSVRHSSLFAQKRMQNLHARAFRSAQDDPYRAWPTSNLSPNAGLEEDLPEMQRRAADMYRSNTVASSAVEGRVSYEIGVGIRCKPMVYESDVLSQRDAETFNREVTRLYEQFSHKRVDRERISTLPQFQKLVNRSFATFGEAFVVYGSAQSRGPLTLAMTIIPAEQIETPPQKAGDPLCIMGIQKNKTGQVIGYWARKSHPGEAGVRAKPNEWEFIPRFDPDTGLPRVSHIFEPMFPGQLRGFPWLANGNALARMKDLDDVFEAELIAKQLEACVALIFTGGENSTSPMRRAEGNSTGETHGDNRIEEFYPGMVHYANEGESVDKVDPSRPGTTFTPFIEQGLRSVAAALNYPYEILAKNFLRVTYSSGRLAMLDGRLGFRMRTQTFKDMFLRDLHENVIYEAIMGNVLTIAMKIIGLFQSNPIPFLAHIWRGHERGLLDPEKENKAHDIALRPGNEFESRTEILDMRGIDMAEHEQTLLEEGKRKIEREVALAVHRKDLEQKNGLDHGESFDPESREKVSNTESESVEADNGVVEPAA